MTDGFVVPRRGATWVFTGDSITHGVVHTYGARSWVELVHERIRGELERLTDIVVNSGVSGWTAPQVNAEFDHLVARFTPNVVSIALGTNDALAGRDGLAIFETAMADLVSRSSDLGATVVLHTPVLTMSDAPDMRRKFLPVYAEKVRSMADAHGCVLVDHERYWLDHFAGAAPTPWMDDHTHPNAVGHRHMANLTLRTFGLGELEDRTS